jgi:integrase
MMTWQPDKARWRKMYKGSWYYVACSTLGAPPSKEGSFKAAIEWWKRKQAEIDAQAPEHPHAGSIAKWERRRGLVRGHDPKLAEELTSFIQRIKQLGEDDPPDVAPETMRWLRWMIERGFELPDDLEVWELEHLIEGRLYNHLERASGSAEPVPDDRTVGGQADRWLSAQRARADSGQISPGGYENLRLSITYLRDWLGGELPVEKIDEKRIDAYYPHLLEKVSERVHDKTGKEGWSRDHASKTFRVAKAFIHWLWERDLIKLPRNLESKAFRFGKSPKSVPTMTVAEFRSLFENATGQLRLHLLLMANAGFTQTDIAELRDDEVDWSGGRIVRKRSKTRDHEDVPTVDYKMWPATLELLRQYRSGGELVLLTESGNLWAYEVMLDGKMKSTDNIASNYTHLKRKLKGRGIVAKPLKLIRKTSASLLGSHEVYGRFATHFLGHSPRSIADKHYVRPDQNLFDEAVAWLGKQYGF